MFMTTNSATVLSIRVVGNYMLGKTTSQIKILKVVSFEKKIFKDGAQFSVEIELIVKSATDLQEVKNELKKEIEISETPILNEATISVNNISGYDILSGIPTWKQRQVVFFANGMAYIFKYASPEEYYRMYEETFDHIINSFVIK